MSKFDALLIVSFGGPEGPDQIDDFLNRIAEGKNIPAKRLEEVKQRYLSFGGVSPANENNRKLIAELRKEFESADGDLKNIPIYFGNRNSPPFIDDALQAMQKDGRTKALAFITSAFASYSSCRQYLENIKSAQENNDSDSPTVERLRHFYNHPLFIKIHADAIMEALSKLPKDSNPHILFSAHSLPLILASNCDYPSQLLTACEMTMKEIALQNTTSQKTPTWELVYQSISGSPENWLGPDILSSIDRIGQDSDNPNPKNSAILVSPIGFLASHMEVIFDLDTDAKNHAENLGLEFIRAKTPQEDARFASLIIELVKERVQNIEPKSLDGNIPPNICAPNCCLPKGAK